MDSMVFRSTRGLSEEQLQRELRRDVSEAEKIKRAREMQRQQAVEKIIERKIEAAQRKARVEAQVELAAQKEKIIAKRELEAFKTGKKRKGFLAKVDKFLAGTGVAKGVTPVVRKGTLTAPPKFDVLGGNGTMRKGGFKII